MSFRDSRVRTRTASRLKAHEFPGPIGGKEDCRQTSSPRFGYLL